MFESFDSGNPDYNIEKMREINPATPSFQQWAEKNKDNLGCYDMSIFNTIILILYRIPARYKINHSIIL